MNRRLPSEVTIKGASSATVPRAEDAQAFDRLLWEVLWKPLGLPRDIQRSFMLEGDSIDLSAQAGNRLVGCLVAVWTTDTDVELRHLAVTSEAQGQGIGTRLVSELVQSVARKGCRRVHTIARNTSAGFFRQLGFRSAPGEAPEHPAFRRHGISFVLMERRVEPTGTGEA